MQFVKILMWVLFLVGGFIFWWSNESRSSLDVGMAIIEARTSTFTLGALLLGFVPTWLLLRGSKWRLTRRIRSLEASARPAPAPTPTPLDLSKENIAKPAPADAPKSTEPASVIPPVESKAVKGNPANDKPAKDKKVP